MVDTVDTVDTVGTVGTVDTVDTVGTVDAVDTVDTVGTVDAVDTVDTVKEAVGLQGRAGAGIVPVREKIGQPWMMSWISSGRPEATVSTTLPRRRWRRVLRWEAPSMR